MNGFENKVLNTIIKHNMLHFGESVLVGLSGGADSCCLLTVLKNLSSELGLSIVAAHLNHGIRGDEAIRDMEFSKQFAEKSGICFVSKTVSVPQYAKSNKISDEMAGRELRYKFFRDLCSEYNCTKIAVAHNMNDRAETVLLNLIRGSGANGLSGIKPCNMDIIRPLIEVSRSEIENYALDKGIDYVTDSTNNEDIYARNIVRNKVLTQMAEINPNVIENIIRTSDILISENELLDKLILKDCPVVFSHKQAAIDRNVFSKLDNAHKRRILLKALETVSGTTANISFQQLENAVQIDNTGKKYHFTNNINIVCTNTQIILTPENIDIQPYEYKFSTDNICYVAETNTTYRCEMTTVYDKEPGAVYISADNIDCTNLILRTRREGDFFSPSGFNGTKKIKKFFIDARIPIHQRNLYPLLVCNGKILAILPLRVDDKYIINEKTKKILKINIYGGTYERK